MMLILSRIILTLFLGWLIYLVWVNNVDLVSWVNKKSKALLPIAENEKSSNQEILNVTTGGDSFAWLNTAGISTDGNFAVLVINHEGKYILKNLKVKIAPLGDFRKVSGLSLSSVPIIPGTFTESETFDLKKDTARTLENLNLKGREAIGFNIFFETDYKKWKEQFRMLKIEGKWRRAISVTDDETQKVLKEVIDNGYPRNQHGEIEWYTPTKNKKP